MIFPSFLNKGDKVAIVAPAKVVPAQAVKESITIIESWGLEVNSGLYLFDAHHVFAGTDNQRLTDFQYALDAPDIKAIFCARGGYGTVRILDQLDWTQFLKFPKWIVGFSDITYLLGKINQLGVASIHGPMPALFSDPNGKSSIEYLKGILFGNYGNVRWSVNKFNRNGTAKGQLVGGNLTILQQMIGCKGDFETDGKILFIEEIDEHLYHFERMLYHLKRSGKFDRLNGLLVGHLTNMKDNATPFGLGVEQIVINITKEYSFPIGFGLPFGHESLNHPLIVGADTLIEIGDYEVSLEYKTSEKST